jgi:hypothetical protein
MVVKHNTWSFREFQGGEFRVCYVDAGWTYSDVLFQVKEHWWMRKWIFFGPRISYWFNWSKPFSRSEIDDLLPVRPREFWYSESKVNSDFQTLAKHYCKRFGPDIEIESQEDEEELEFLVGYRPGEDLERNPTIAPIRTPYI